MAIRLFRYRHVKLGDNVVVKVSRMLLNTDFGVRNVNKHHYHHHHHNEEEEDVQQVAGRSLRRGRFVCTGTPGTGFFERTTESDTYDKFVRQYNENNLPNYWRFMLGREFSYDKEINRAHAKLDKASSKTEKMILESYINSLTLAKQAEYLQRLVVATKQKMKHKSPRELSSAHSHLKGRVRHLEHDLRSSQIVIEQMESEEVAAAYKEFCETFEEVANSRRIWTLKQQGRRISLTRVFFDMGMFDFIASDTDTPIMRNADGECFYIYPAGFIRARGSLDFDLISWDKVKAEYREATGESLTLTNASFDGSYGRTMGEVYFSGLDLSFYFAHRSVARKLAEAVNNLKAAL